MRDFNRDGDSGGRRGFGSRGASGGTRDYNRPQMHKAICSSCGQECELPFVPTGDRPVYCRDCFRKNGNDTRPSFDRRDNNDNPRPPFRKFEERPPRPHGNPEMDAINHKLDEILRLLKPGVPPPPPHGKMPPPPPPAGPKPEPKPRPEKELVKRPEDEVIVIKKRTPRKPAIVPDLNKEE